MSLQTLFSWFVDNIFAWVIAGLASWGFVHGLKNQKIGEMVASIVIGGAAYYFATHPVEVLQKIGEIFGKIFGG